jgi:glycosyltransferase involved in cell wall biosynthesis
MKHALIIASVASHIKQFCMNDAHILQEMGYKVDVAANFQNGNAIDDETIKAFENALTAEGIDHYQINFTRDIKNLGEMHQSYKELADLLAGHSYDLIHCHTPIAGFLTRFCAKKYRKSGTKVLYTAHGFHFFKGAPTKNWLLFYPAEKLCAKWTDVLITINQEDYALAKAKFHPGSVKYIPGVGIDLEKFHPGKFSQETIQATREHLGLSDGQKMLLSVGELTPRKNHELVIRALGSMQDLNLQYFICGCGELQDYLTSLIETLGLKDNVHLLGYRTDVDLLYACADLFVFPSKQEGLPVALMEAIASGTPSIASNIRGNRELLNKDARFELGNIDSFIAIFSNNINMNYSWKTNELLNQIKPFDIRAITQKISSIYNLIDTLSMGSL